MMTKNQSQEKSTKYKKPCSHLKTRCYPSKLKIRPKFKRCKRSHRLSMKKNSGRIRATETHLHRDQSMYLSKKSQLETCIKHSLNRSTSQGEVNRKEGLLVIKAKNNRLSRLMRMTFSETRESRLRAESTLLPWRLLRIKSPRFQSIHFLTTQPQMIVIIWVAALKMTIKMLKIGKDALDVKS